MITASVIVPALNEEKYIANCLKSIKTQKTVFPYEIIVVDGGSEDETVRIARKYSDKVFICSGGIGKGRNFGAKNAKGKILVFIDADTTIPPEYLNKSISSLILLGADALSTGFVFENESEKTKLVRRIVNDLFSFYSSMGDGRLLGFSIVVWKDVFEKCGGFDDVPIEDGAFANKLKKNGYSIKFVTEPTVATASRRIDKIGVAEALKYYLSLVAITDGVLLNFVKKYSKYRDYLPVR